MKPTRYNDAAVILHWLIALLMIGLLAMGKYMHGLDDDSADKYTLVQLHKSFGIVALLLIIVRLVWRTRYTAPAHPLDAPRWEKMAAKYSHIALYLLMLTIPFSGWLMVSASPLNLDTILFGAVEWPHVPGSAALQANNLEDFFHHTHEIAGGILIALLFVHIGAALKHHIVNKDDVLKRMLPDWASRAFKLKLGTTFAALAAATAGFALIASTNQPPPRVISANNSNISFNAMVTGEDTLGQFNESTITFTFDEANPGNSSLIADVVTASAFTDNFQIDGSLPEPDWFDSEQYPTANFTSSSVTKTPDHYLVKGSMTIKSSSNDIEFPMIITEQEGKQVASGEFVINRFDYKIGSEDQPDEEYVGADITLTFSFDL